MSKLAKRGNASSNVVLAATTPAAHQMFGGLTLVQIGTKYDLSDEDAEWYTGRNPNNGEEIRSALITVEGVVYQIPISRKLTDEHLNNFDILPNCMCRVTFKSVKDENGLPVMGADGKPVLGTEAYMSLGRPAGIVLVDTQRIGMFADAPELEEEDVTADANVKAKA